MKKIVDLNKLVEELCKMFVDKECLVVEFEKKVSEIENKRF